MWLLRIFCPPPLRSYSILCTHISISTTSCMVLYLVPTVSTTTVSCSPFARSASPSHHVLHTGTSNMAYWVSLYIILEHLNLAQGHLVPTVCTASAVLHSARLAHAQRTARDSPRESGCLSLLGRLCKSTLANACLADTERPTRCRTFVVCPPTRYCGFHFGSKSVQLAQRCILWFSWRFPLHIV